jgi:hypothetical protein
MAGGIATAAMTPARAAATDQPAATTAAAQQPRPRRPGLLAVSLMISGCGLLYAVYRGYYGFGGTIGMFGRPSSQPEWQAINLAAAAILLVVALLPLAALPLWRRPRLRRVLLGMCWLFTVGFVMHALVDDTQRMLSLVGGLHLDYPFFTTVDKRAADIQDLAFNETWFAAEGLLWGILALIILGPSPARRWWIGTAITAVVALTSIGLLSALHITGRVIVF